MSIHAKINPSDLNESGKLLSNETIEKIRTLHSLLNERDSSIFKISRKDYPAIYCAKEEPRSSLMFNGKLFLIYRDRRKTREESYVAKNHSDSECTDIKLNSIKLVQDAESGEWAILRISTKQDYNEFRALQKLNRLYGNAQRENSQKKIKNYSVEKLCSGKSVYCFFGSSLSLKNKIFIALNTLQALQQLHAKGVVHGDAGPHNFMCEASSSSFTVMPFDFETASFREDELNDVNFNQLAEADLTRFFQDFLFTLCPFDNYNSIEQEKLNDLMEEENLPYLEALILAGMRFERQFPIQKCIEPLIAVSIGQKLNDIAHLEINEQQKRMKFLNDMRNCNMDEYVMAYPPNEQLPVKAINDYINQIHEKFFENAQLTNSSQESKDYKGLVEYFKRLVMVAQYNIRTNYFSLIKESAKFELHLNYMALMECKTIMSSLEPEKSHPKTFLHSQ